MLKKIIVVGLGGSGGKTVRTAHAALSTQLRNSGFEGDMPQGWQFIHVDVPTAPDGMDPALPPTIPGSYHGLVNAGTTYAMVDSGLTFGATPETVLRATSGWRPNPRQVGVPIALGAGQYRALGRVVTVQSLARLSRAIEQSMARVNYGSVEGQLREVTQRLGGDARVAMDPKTYLFIVSSMAGGSGAGMIVDTIELAMAQHGNKSAVAWLFAPDVFDELPAAARQGVRPNALATLMELTAASWSNEGLPYSGGLYQARGVLWGTRERDNPVPTMIIGRTNGTITFPDQNSVYAAAGRMVAGLMISERALDDLVAYAITNRMSTSPTVDNIEFKDSFDTPPFQGFGFARISLGRDLFADYVVEWLARAAVEVLLRKHELTRKRNDERTDAQLIEKIVGDVFKTFLDRCGLDERGPDRNQVIDAMWDIQRATHEEQELIAKLTDDVRAVFAKPTPAQTIAAQISATAGASKRQFLHSQEAHREAAAADWVESVQEAILEAVVEASSEYGLPVTQALLERLISDELPAILVSLREEANDNRNWFNDLDSYVYRALTEGPGTLAGNDPAVDMAIGWAASCLGYLAHAERLDEAHDLLDDLRENLILPLRDAVSDALAILEEADDPQGLLPSQVRTWPKLDEVPRRFTPPLNELLLEDEKSFPALRARLVAASIGIEGLGAADANRVAVEQVAQGRSAPDEPVRAITREAAWRPRHDRIRRSGAPQRGTFHIALTADDLIDYARAWIAPRDRAMGKHLGQSLRDYLNDSNVGQQERIARVAKFTQQLAAGLKAARPLVSVSPQLHQVVHGTPQLGTSTIVSEIPVKGLKSVEEQVRIALVNTLGAEDGEAMAKVFGDGEVSEVDIFSVTAPAEALAFESIIGPIAEDWFAVAGHAGARTAFWTWRRSRPIPEFVPMAPAYRRHFVRGWFAAKLMGILDEPLSGATRVQDPQGAMLSFPDPLLGDARQAYDRLPSVLKSVAVAFLSARQKSSLSPLEPYFRLIRLGASTGDSDGEFRRWLASSPTNHEAAQDLLPNLDESYRSVIDSVRDPLNSPRVFEIADDVLSAFSDLAGTLARPVETRVQVF